MKSTVCILVFRKLVTDGGKCSYGPLVAKTNGSTYNFTKEFTVSLDEVLAPFALMQTETDCCTALYLIIRGPFQPHFMKTTAWSAPCQLEISFIFCCAVFETIMHVSLM